MLTVLFSLQSEVVLLLNGSRAVGLCAFITDPKLHMVTVYR